MESWKFTTSIVDGQKYEINGYNIWGFEWENTGQKIAVKDPRYGQAYIFNVYKLKDIEVFFAAGEFSNCIWGIYEKQTV